MSEEAVGIKEEEMRRLAECGCCHKKLGESNGIFFWKVTVDRYAMNHDAIRRQSGLAMMLGSPQIARVMGTDEDIAQQVGDPVVISVCQTCLLKPQNLAAIEEDNRDDEHDDDEDGA